MQRSEHIYDGENRIKSQSWSVGGNTQRSESYTYSTVDGTLTNMTTANGETITFGYDKLKRLESVSGVTGQMYTYRDLNNKQTTTQIADIIYTGVTDKLKLSYAYDAGGNIDTIRQSDGPNAEQDEGTIIAQYAYDVQNQLVEEILPNVTYEYVYDTGYNLRHRQVKTYRNGSSTPEITTYEYGNTDWLDLLTKYNGQQITYDTIGNPLTYNNGTAWTFTWQGAHDLATATTNDKQIEFHYDMDGVRDSKTVNGVKHEYITQGGNVTLERWNDGEAKSLEFIYDNGGAPYSVIYTHGGTSETYYYVLNQQGDVIRIVNGSGATVAEYTYNGWGEILSVNNKIGTFGTLNPIRYRGYYYDTELNMYYLQSRYYDPVVKRMLCADDENIVDDADLNDNNLFSYCDNNPSNRKDEEGDVWQLALAGGGTASTGAAITAIGSITPAGWVVLGVVAVVTVGAIVYSNSRSHNCITYSKAKSNYGKQHKKSKAAKKPKKKQKSRSSDPIGKRFKFKTRKAAKEAVERAIRRKNRKEGRNTYRRITHKHRGNSKNKSPHFHVGNKKRIQ